MSATDTVRLVRYQGARARWAARSWAGWPWWAYQTIARLMQTSPNGTRRCTERVVRVRAWPTPARWRPSRKVVSTGQRAAYRCTSSAGVAARSVVTRARSKPSGEPTGRLSTTWTGWPLSAPYHWQATDRQGLLVLQLAVAAHGEGGPSVAGHGGEHDQRREPVACYAGAAWA